jgi:hypothetical protein
MGARTDDLCLSYGFNRWNNASRVRSFMIRMARLMTPHHRNNLAQFLALTIATVLAFGLASAVDAETVVGSVTEVSGKATVQRASSMLDATVNMPIQLHDRLTTGLDGHLLVTLSDPPKTKIRLAQRSVVDIDEMTLGTNGAPSSAAVTLVGGSVRSFVSSTFGHVFNYQTKTSNSISAVRGTDFEVDFSQGRARPGFSGCGIYTDIQVFSGLVEVANITQPTNKVEVSGGFHTTVPCFAAPLPAGPLGLAARPGAAGALTGSPPPICPPPVR